MNRMQAAKELRNNREGLPVQFEGVEVSFEVRPLWLEPEIEWDILLEKPVKAMPGRMVALFRQADALKPNGIVRKLTWVQTLNFIRRNFAR